MINITACLVNLRFQRELAPSLPTPLKNTGFRWASLSCFPNPASHSFRNIRLDNLRSHEYDPEPTNRYFWHWKTWTGPLDTWTIFWKMFWTNFLDQFFWTIFWSTVELCVCLKSRLVHHQLLHVSLCVYGKLLLNLSIFLLSLILSDEITEFPVLSRP